MFSKTDYLQIMKLSVITAGLLAALISIGVAIEAVSIAP